MACETHIDPSPVNFKAFKDMPCDTPINMLNLLLYRYIAEYPQGHEHAGRGWSGRRAYEEYGRTSGPIFRKFGGQILWRGRFETVVTGPEGERWEDAFIAQYPNAGAFLAMIKDPDYQQAVVNRTAALVESRLVRFAPGEVGEGFG
jgi:uncharacterized protein (DUF1330 family)